MYRAGIMMSRLLVTGLMMCSVYSTTYAVPMLRVDVSDTTPMIGDTITADIVITEVADLFIFNLDLAFDARVLGVIGVTPGPFLGTGGLTFGALGLFGFDPSTPGAIQDVSDSLLGPVAGVYRQWHTGDHHL